MSDGAVEVSSLSAEELESKLSSWAGSVAASEYRWLRLVAEYDRRKLYERWECQSCSAVEPAERSAEQRRADAVVAVAAGFLDGGAGSSGGDRYQVIVSVDAADVAEGGASVDGAGPIDNETLRRLCCDASLISLVEDEDGQPVAVSNKTRTIPAALRRALRARDKACRFPGCPNSSWTDAHHRQHWIDGGPTNLDNLLLLCRHHHRAVHEGRWTIEHDEHGRLRFRNKADCRYAETLQPDITELPNNVAARTILPTGRATTSTYPTSPPSSPTSTQTTTKPP